MKTMNLSFSNLKLTIIFLLFSLFGCQQKEDAVKIAFNLPLTGDFAVYGRSIQDGAMFALEKNPEFSNQFRFDWQDNAGIPRNTVNIFQQQVLRPVDVYVSGVKPQTMSIIDLVSKRGIPHFVWVFDAFITEQYDYTYRTWVSFKHEPVMFKQYINKVNAERIAIIYPQLPHTDEEFNEILIPQLKDKEVFVERFPIELNDFRNIASKTRSFEPDLIILSGFQNHLISMIRTFREYNLIKENNVICSYDLLDAAHNLDKSLIEGLRVVTPSFELAADSNTVRWRNDFHKRFNRKPKYTEAYSYDMVNILFDIYRRIPAETEVTPKIFEKALLETNLNGITGNLRFDDTGDLVVDLRIGVYRNGVLKEDI